MANSIYNARRVLVTGQTGFKGAWLSLWLNQLGAHVTGYALAPATSPNLFEASRLEELIDDRRGDIRDRNSMQSLIEETQPEIVFHLAAQALVRESYTDPVGTLETNIMGTVNLLDALREAPSVKAIVVVTSDKCYENRESLHAYSEGDPLGGHDPYSASKGCTEIVASAYSKSFFSPRGVHLATARAGNILGGGDWASDRIIPDAVRALKQGQRLQVRHPNAIRPWQHVLDAIRGYMMLGASLLNDQTASTMVGPWNFAAPADDARTVSDILDLFFGDHDGWEVPANTVPPVHEAQLLTLSSEKAHTGLNWTPRWSVEQTIEHTANWYHQFNEGQDARVLCHNDIELHGSLGQ